ncbi:MAG TPA: ClpX C4-type zinc finger protein [Archangium sp.]|jgi:hypothetical protein|uniref:ClpX C4-type zinc finger protein n=1 Tax=Archangium sp. TaxID=1872627 RepID=UPI002ED90373
MAENVRDVLRAAQAAELGGDKARAIELLRRAAELYRRAGGLSRAEQLLRYALKLDPSRADVQEEIGRLGQVTRVEEPPPAASPPVPEEEPDDDPDREVFVLEEDSSTSLQQALREAELAVGRRLNPVAVAAEVVRSAVLSVEVTPETVRAPVPSPPPPSAAPPSPPPSEATEASPRSKGEGVFIERGPTRADPSLEAWCSFCCRPRSEVGSLVAGPAGAFICSACIGESGALLGGVAPPLPRPRVVRPITFGLVGQESARASLERALETGVRHVLLLGPEGSGKSTWMRALAEQGRGVLGSSSDVDNAPLDVALLVEDVDRLPPAEQTALAAFLARHPERTVVMTARGHAATPGPVLVSDSGRLPVPTTAALSEAVEGSLPVSLLERVRLLVPLESPSVEELVEIARRQLASREDCHLSEEALVALATEAARSPRSGHELQALLARVPPGTWRVELKKRGKARPARRGRRKGTS